MVNVDRQGSAARPSAFTVSDKEHPLRVVPVIDLLHGQVVRGIAGNRAAYQPIKSQLAPDASPAAVAAAFASLGFSETYVADLDAIAGRPINGAAYTAIRRAGLAHLAIDAGINSTAAAASLLEAAANAAPSAAETDSGAETSVVCGLESLPSPQRLGELLALLGPRRLIFSLDLKAGKPLNDAADWAGRTPLEIAQAALAMGVQRLIVLDLADVGTAGGTRTEHLVRAILARHEGVELWAGGGVRCRDDLLRLQDWGVAAVLVASALHDGRLGPADLPGFIGGSRRGTLTR